MIRFNHTADGHSRRDRAEEFFASLDALESASDDVDFNIIAGDLFDYPAQNTGASRFPELVGRLARLAKKAAIVMVEGTPTHDADGCLDVLEKASERITVLRPGVAYFFQENGFVGQKYAVQSRALILGIPEPRKKWLNASDSGATVDDSMRSLLLGYAAIRKQYANLPCVLVYHGPVMGAKMPNGERFEGGVSIDDLAMVEADYYALGHIHKPQRVGESRGLNAYYAGAMYPASDWKDAEFDFGFNRVDIGNSGMVDVERIPYPHPTLIKIESKIGDAIDLDQVEGRRVWVEITAKKEQALTIDTESQTASLLKSGAAPGSRVTIKIEATETVRAGAIATLRRLRDKFTLWMENSSRKPTETQLLKTDVLEVESACRGLTLNGGEFSFDKLTLRGARGIWKKQRKDEIVLDLTAFDDGIVGLIGPNGRGKTTIMNNFHPWPEMPNMGGPLHKQFRLKDSLREVEMTDHKTGIRYRSRIKMNPTLKSPTCEYYLDQQLPGADWAPVPGIDGRLASYESEVNRIFGTLEMYLRTAFMMQFPTADYPDLSRATKGAKKSIMAALAGLDFYEIYKAAAKAHGDDAEGKVNALKSKIDVLTEGLGDPAALGVIAADAERVVEEMAAIIPNAEAALKAADDAYATLKARGDDQQAIQSQIIDLTNKHTREHYAVDTSRRQLDALRATVARRPAAADAVDMFGELSAHVAKLTAEKTAKLEADAKIQAAYQAQKDAHALKLRGLERAIDDAEKRRMNALNPLRSEIDMARAEIVRTNAELAKPVADHCPLCRQALPADAMAHVQQERESKRTYVDAQKGKIATYEKTATVIIEESDAELAGIRARIADLVPPPPLKIIPYDDAALRHAQDAIRAIDIAAASRTIEEAASAQARIEELTKRVAEAGERMAEYRAASDALRAKIDDALPAAIREMEQIAADARIALRTATDRLAKAKADAEHARKAIAEYEAAIARIESMRAEMATIQAELTDWRVLQDACGQNGIQALELDAVCPSIAAVATALLREYEDGRYSIRFDTTREGGKGNQIEDFLIMVIDSKDGEEQEFETLSGGEAVWVRKALQDAFGIIRGQNAGIKYLTGFLDESDSALFPEARIAYFRMLESAHAQSVRKHTVMVTHSIEIQEMIQQRIDVTALEARKDTALEVAA